jgi:hypothetical protein
MDRLSVLHAASVGGRELNGYGDTSKPTPGSSADLIFLTGSPLESHFSLEMMKMALTQRTLLEIS